MNLTRLCFLASNLTPVIIESPFMASGTALLEDHITYARRCVRHSLAQQEAPIASHLLYTQSGILQDDMPHERELGIAAGLTWYRLAERCIVYCDYGISEGMRAGILVAKNQSVPVYRRTIGRNS